MQFEQPGVAPPTLTPGGPITNPLANVPTLLAKGSPPLTFGGNVSGYESLILALAASNVGAVGNVGVSVDWYGDLAATIHLGHDDVEFYTPTPVLLTGLTGSAALVTKGPYVTVAAVQSGGAVATLAVLGSVLPLVNGETYQQCQGDGTLFTPTDNSGTGSTMTGHSVPAAGGGTLTEVIPSRNKTAILTVTQAANVQLDVSIASSGFPFGVVANDLQLARVTQPAAVAQRTILLATFRAPKGFLTINIINLTAVATSPRIDVAFTD